MFSSHEDAKKFIKDEGIEFVDVRFIDLPGIMQHFNVPTVSFDDSAFEDGLMFDGSSIRGFQAINESDMKLLPDVKTAYVDPFRKAKTLVMNFSIVDPYTGEPYSRDPRGVAAKAEAYLTSTGIADTVYFGAEAEFYVFDDVRYDSQANESYYHIDSIEGAWNTGRVEEGGNRGYKTRYKGGYFPVPPVDHFADTLGDAPVGITVPAPVRHGVTPMMANLDEAWEGLQADKFFADKLGRSVTLVNDADAAGLAEVQYGAAKGTQGVVILTTLGTGIGTAVINDGILLPNTEFGHLLESFCVNEILKQLSWQDESYLVGHWRTHDGAEVDLVIETPDGRVLGVEVKASGRVDRADAAGLRALRTTLGAAFIGGIVLHTGQRAFTLDGNIHAVPIDRLWSPLPAVGPRPATLGDP